MIGSMRELGISLHLWSSLSPDFNLGIIKSVALVIDAMNGSILSLLPLFCLCPESK